jgi:hypothetical protein
MYFNLSAKTEQTTVVHGDGAVCSKGVKYIPAQVCHCFQTKSGAGSTHTCLAFKILNKNFLAMIGLKYRGIENNLGEDKLYKDDKEE